MPALLGVRVVAIFLLAIALTVVLTHPIAARLDRGGRLNSGDGHWSIWCVTWVTHALTSNPRRLYNANIFYPHQRTLAYSENNIVAGVFGIPAYLLTRSPFATHNSAVLTAFVLSFLAAYALARHLTQHTGISIVAGIAFAYCPFVFARTAHIQLMMIFTLPLALLALHRLVERRTLGRAVGLALALAVAALACGYYGILGGLTVGLGIVIYGVSRGLWREPRYWGFVALAAVLSAVLVIPFFLPYVWMQRELGFKRTLRDAAMFSADGAAWLASSAWSHRWLHPILGRWSEVLFPGFLTTSLGLFGLAVLTRDWWLARLAASPASTRAAGAFTIERLPPISGGADVPAAPASNPAVGSVRRPLARTASTVPALQPVAGDTVFFYALAGVIAFWSSFGPNAGLYTALYHAVPVFSMLRAPARFGILVTLALVVLMAMGVSRWLMNLREPRTRTIVTACLAVLMTLELVAIPLPFRDAGRLNNAYRLLATLPRRVVVEFPFFTQRRDFPRHAWYMSSSTFHWQSLVNGYSDHIPQDFRQMVRAVNTFPSRAAFAKLRERRTRYVVIHLSWYDERSRARLLERLDAYRGYLQLLSRDEGVLLYEIKGWPGD